MEIKEKGIGFYSIEKITIVELTTLLDTLNCVIDILHRVKFDALYDEDYKKALEDKLVNLAIPLKEKMGSKTAENIDEGIIRKAITKLQQG